MCQAPEIIFLAVHEYEKDGVSLLVSILHCQSQVCMAWTGLVSQLLFLSYSHDKWKWRLLPSSVDKSMLYLSSRVKLKYQFRIDNPRKKLAWRLLVHETAVATTYWVVCWIFKTKIQFKDKLSAHSLFVHLLKYSIKFTIMKAQYLSNVFSSLIIFLCKKSCLCVLCMSVCSWDKNTNLVEHKHFEPETDFGTVLNMSPKCLLTLFVFFLSSFSWRAWKITALPPSSLNLWRENFAFPKNKIIGHCNKHIQLDNDGECKDGCAYWVNTCLWTKKSYESWKKEKKTNKKNVLLTYIWKQAKIELVPIKYKK